MGIVIIKAKIGAIIELIPEVFIAILVPIPTKVDSIIILLKLNNSVLVIFDYFI